MAENEISAKGRYSDLERFREGPLRRARKNARLTIPYIAPPDGADESTELYDPFQSVGQQGTANLRSKMTLALMPPNEPFWRHDPDDLVAMELEEREEGTRNKAEEQIGIYDRTAMRRLEAAGDRSKVELANTHLLIAGNVAMDIREEKSRVIGLANYVVKRDARGTVIEAVLYEDVHPDGAPKQVRDELAKMAAEGNTAAKASGEKDTYELYTHLQMVDGKYQGFQEIEGVRVAGSEFMKKPEDLGILFLRLHIVDGQSYGRSFVEGLYGDLNTLESLTQAITDAADAASKIIFLVDPHASTKVKDLANASNLDFVSGKDTDVSTLQVAKAADMRVALDLATAIEKRLQEMFLMRNAATRNAERVTAEEIRYIALEIDEALSGVYTLLSLEFQLPYIRLKLKTMKGLPSLPEDTVNLVITTGLDALRRGHEMQKLRTLQEALVQAYGPEEFKKLISPRTFATKLATALGIVTQGLFNDPAEAQAEATADQAIGAAAQAAPQLIQGATLE